MRQNKREEVLKGHEQLSQKNLDAKMAFNLYQCHVR
jgi:hypothetical protein